MAAQSKFVTHTCTGSAVKLTDILGGARLFLGTIVGRAFDANVGVIAWGGPGVTTSDCGGFLNKGDAIAIDLTNKFFNSDEWYFIGTVGDKIAFTLLN